MEQLVKEGWMVKITPRRYMTPIETGLKSPVVSKSSPEGEFFLHRKNQGIG